MGTPVSQGTWRRPRTEGWLARRGRRAGRVAVTAALSRRPPSVTMPGRAAHLGAQREDVAERAGGGVPAGVHDEHVAGPQLLDRPLLGVHAVAVLREQVLAQRQEAQRVGAADHASVRLRGAHAVDGHVRQAAPAQLRAEGGDGDRAQLRPRAARSSSERRGRTPAPCAASRLARCGRASASRRTGPGRARRRRSVAQAAGARPPAASRVDLDLDHVAGADDARRRRACR